MKTKSMQRLVAAVLAFVMVLSWVPFGSLQVNAVTNTYTFDATTAATEATEATEASDATDATTGGANTSGKVDVWDFGAEQLDTSVYNNMLDADEINSWYPGVEPGTTGVTTSNFTTSDGQLSFIGGGKSNHRLRTTNTALTAYDHIKYLQDADGNVYSGYIYSNAGGNTAVQIQIAAEAGDILTFVHGSNGTAAAVHFEAPSGNIVTTEFTPADSKHAQVTTFYAAETGTYKFYYSVEKLVVARIYREHTNQVTVVGNVTAPVELTDYSVVFTNDASGAVVEAPVIDGVYIATLNDNYTYTLSLKDANGYIITGEKTLTIPKGAASSASLDVNVIAANFATITGNITGLDADALGKVSIKFVSDAIYVPEAVISGSTYTAEVEVGVEYEVVVSGINDYELTSAAKASYTEDGTADITFAEKAKYAVTIVPEGATLDDLAGATVTFTNLNEEGYAYSFIIGTDAIALRDGTYSVKVTDSGIYVQQMTSNLKVNGAAASKNIPFSSDIEEDMPAGNTYVLDAALDIPAFAQGDKADGATELFKDYFTIMYSAKNKVDGSNKTFDDGYTATQRLNFGGKTEPSKGMINSVKFTTANPATIKIWWVSGGDGREFAIYDNAGTILSETAEGSVKNSLYISELSVDAAGTYFLGVPDGSNYLFKLEVTVLGGRADWDSVAEPEIVDAADNGSGQISVTVSANIGYDGADEVVVTMYDAQGDEVASQSSTAEGTSRTMTFNPAASGDYTFRASLRREGETDKTSEDKVASFVLPLAAPGVSSATSIGGGSVSVVWGEVNEATAYNLYVDGVLISTTDKTEYVVADLTVGNRYAFSVSAVRGSEEGTQSASIFAIVTEEAQRIWNFLRYGPSTNDTDNGYVGGVNSDGKVTVYSENGKGKIQPKDSDGLAYYYTAIPADQSFTFRATVTIDEWTYSNGLEGFGLLAMDSLPEHGAAVHWTNQYMAMLGKVEYFYDFAENEIVSAANDNTIKYSMKLGLGVLPKLGITPENIDKILNMDSETILQVATGITYPLDLTAAEQNLANGYYNIVGNAANAAQVPTTIAEKTEFILEIRKTNTGYFITYYDAEGNIIGQQKNYDPEALQVLDSKNIYVGFFAARNARATFSDINLTTIAPEDDLVVVASGTCGENLTWTLDDKGTLTISGTGSMYDYRGGSVPWYDYRDSVKEVVIEKGATSIGKYAFYNCSSLKSVTIGDSMMSIGSNAFDECSSLEGVIIPGSVTSIGRYAFHDCSSLSGIWVDADNQNYSSDSFGVLFNKDKTELIAAPSAMGSSYIVPDSVTGIGDCAFYECSSLQSATIPYGVTSIGGSAFDGCSSLESVTIPESVTNIGMQAFANCSSLGSITIPEGVTCIEESTFYGCSSLQSVTIPNSVTDIGIYAFYGCSSLVRVDIGDGITSLDGYTFAQCTSLEQVSLPNGITYIGYFVFENCIGLETITIPDSVTGIGTAAFYDCSGLTSIRIPQGVTQIEHGAFYDCISLAEIEFLGDVPEIDEDAFVNVSATAYYPASNAAWTEENMLDYGGDLTWAANELAAILVYGKTLALEDIVQLSYYFTLENIASSDIAASGLQVWNEADYAASADPTYTVAGLTKNGSYYNALSQDIPAKNMGDMIYARGYVTLTDGTTVYSDVIEYSALTYARNQYNKTTEAAVKLKPLLIALMNYGAAAQVQFNYNTGSLMNSFLTAEEQAASWDDGFVKVSAADTAGKYSLQTENSSAVIAKINKSVALEGALAVNLYATLGITDAREVGVLYWDAETYASTDTLTEENAVKLPTVVNGNYRVASIDGVAAKSMSGDCYACVYVVDADGNTHYSELVCYNAHNYAANQIAKNEKPDLVALCKAIVIYGNAAESYFAD